MKLINSERGLDTSNEVNLCLVPSLVFLGTCSLHLEPGNGLNYGNFVKNGGSRSKKRDLSEVNQLGTWSWYLIREILRVSVPICLSVWKNRVWATYWNYHCDIWTSSHHVWQNSRISSHFWARNGGWLSRKIQNRWEMHMDFTRGIKNTFQVD